MVSFRGGVTQALRRAGYHASFACRPPFANVMASGAPVVDWLTQIKRSELARYDAADDKDDWPAREYFGRI